MNGRTIIVPVDGASNIKLEVFDFETLACLHTKSAPTPVRMVGGLAYNACGEEFGWFDDAIRSLPDGLKRAAVIAPVARGASGGLIGRDNVAFLHARALGYPLVRSIDHLLEVGIGQDAFGDMGPGADDDRREGARRPL